MAYEQPLQKSRRAAACDHRRQTWIHLWMVPAMFVTSAGVAGVPLITGLLVRADEVAIVIAVKAAIAYMLGAICWIASLVFRNEY